MSCRTNSSARVASLDRELLSSAPALLRRAAAGEAHLLDELVRRAEAIVELAQRSGEDLSPLAATRLLRTLERARIAGHPPIRIAAALLNELHEIRESPSP